MGLTTHLKKLASDPKTKEMIRKAAAEAQKKAKDPATRAKVDKAVAEAKKAMKKQKKS